VELLASQVGLCSLELGSAICDKNGWYAFGSLGQTIGKVTLNLLIIYMII
jgi:hypothetical protein